MQRLKKSVKLKKLVSVVSVIIIVLISSVIPSYATSAGNDGENYPTIPLYLELRYADKSVFMNVTDRYYYNNTVNHDSVTVSGRVLTSYLATKSIQADGVLMRKYITSDYDVAPVGFEITAPTFYLTRNEGATSFNQVRPYILIPETVYVECLLTYEVFMGGDEPVGTVQRAITSPLGQSDTAYLFEFSEIDAFANSTNWKSCRIDNLSLNSVTMAFTHNSSGSDLIDTFGGTWVINDGFDFGELISYQSDSVFYFPFASNGKRFTGMSFVDGLWLYYLNEVGNVESLEVWSDLNGWLSQEYRTFYVDPDVTWEDVIPGDESMNNVNDIEYWQTVWRNWLISNAIKQDAEGGYDGGPLLHWRYQVQTNEYINSYLNVYTNEYQGLGDYEQAFNDGFALGNYQGFIDGERIGYNKAQQEKVPNVTAWLASAASGFLAFEIIPGISLLSILGIMVALSLAIVLLKFFAGG